MQSTLIACPHCGSSLNFGKDVAAGTRVECLICTQAFFANPVAAPSIPKATIAPKRTPMPKAGNGAAPANVATKAPKAAAKPSTPRQPRDDAESDNKVGAYAVMLGIILLLTGGMAFAIWTMVDTGKNSETDKDGKIALNSKDSKDSKGDGDGKSGAKKIDPDPDKDNANKDTGGGKKIEKKPLDEVEEEEIRNKIKEEIKQTLVRKTPSKPDEKEPDIPVTKITPPKKVIAGVDQEKIDQAIDRGVTYLRQKQEPGGHWGPVAVGYPSLAGLTLLECKVPANDPAVQRTAAHVRSNAFRAERNYDISTTILFLDRLGDPNDRPMIQALALRLMAGQLDDGGWNYPCVAMQGQDMQRLLAYLQSNKAPKGKAQPLNPIRPDALPPYMRNLMAVKNHGKPKGQQMISDPRESDRSDNSNTQFALLALWAARRHDVPCDQAILVAYQRFMVSQTDEGGWSYHAKDQATNTMTCVGLLGLAMGHGTAPDGEPKSPKPALQDPKIQAGLQALARSIGQPVADPTATRLEYENLYFLWSVERVAMLYDLNTIGGKDWYGWGAQLLIAKQSFDGSWQSSFYAGADPTVNTCFALLFLRRSNLVQDLTQTLKLNSGIRDQEK